MPLFRKKNSATHHHCQQETDSSEESSSSNTCCSHCADAFATSCVHQLTPPPRHAGPDMERIERLARPTDRVLRALYEDAQNKSPPSCDRDKRKEKLNETSHFGPEDTEEYYQQPRGKVDLYGFKDQLIREGKAEKDFDKIRVPVVPTRSPILKNSSTPHPDYQCCMVNDSYLSHTESDSSADVLRSSLSEYAADLTHQMFDRGGYNTEDVKESDSTSYTPRGSINIDGFF